MKLPLDSFSWRNDNHKYRTNCKACRNLEEACKRYSITKESYLSMLEAQGSKCAICGVTVDKQNHKTFTRLVVDHDHDTGKVRGLLCHNCNTGLGQFKDDTESLLNAVSYLQSNF